MLCKLTKEPWDLRERESFRPSFDSSWISFGSVDLLRKDIYIYIFYIGQNYFVRKQTVGELCDRIGIGWTCCITCCEVNTGNKRTLVQ